MIGVLSLSQPITETTLLGVELEDPFYDVSTQLTTGTLAISSPKRSIHEEIYRRTHQGAEEPFYVGDIGEIERQYNRWVSNLPRVKPFYAIKCNPNPMIIKRLAALGTGFDCASQAEIETVLSHGVSASRIIYANPCKPASHIRYARDNGVHTMTVDNEDEIIKIHEINPNAKIVLRILVDDSNSVCRFGVKFGMSMPVAEKLIKLCHDKKINCIGISFHVGSGCTDTQSFSGAITQAKNLFDFALSQYGIKFSLLDIGGGFPGANSPAPVKFEDIATRCRPLIDQLFGGDIDVIAEPGRYFASSAFTLCVRVNARRVIHHDDAKGATSYMYYVNDGVYGSFNCLLFDHAVLQVPYLVRFSPKEERTALYDSSIWGPTCDSMDCLTKKISLPKLNINDWLCFDDMGAYTMAASSTFNGFPQADIFYLDTEKNL